MQLAWADGTDPKDKEGRLAYILVTEPAAKLLTLFKLKNGSFYCVCLGRDRMFKTQDLDTAKREAVRWFQAIVEELKTSVDSYLILIDQ